MATFVSSAAGPPPPPPPPNRKTTDRGTTGYLSQRSRLEVT
ncbi:unnamed protein product [Penicillium camemberti]|uniref:Str. FM013 n=1 Tax=Penicillium camemberti (strain FM 013) TaxID=1429867 RepID=A0A0G4PCY3_PENC3|nr:unnamed protein product [Penicillium camemberti]